MRTLADVCAAIVDCEHKTAPAGDGFAYSVGTRAMKDGRIILDRCKPISRATYEGWTRRMTPAPGDLILAREAPVGEVVRVPSAPLVCLGQRTVLLRPDPAKVDPRFLYFWLLGPTAQGLMHSKGAGATVTHLNVADIRSLAINAMPVDLPLQREAARILGSIDDLIENNRQRAESLEQSVKAIYREWFVHFRYPGHENDDVADSSLGPLPSRWSVTTLGDAGEWLSGGTPSTANPAYWDGEIPWITSGSLTSILLDRSERRVTPTGLANGTRLVPRDALLFVVRGMSLLRQFRVGLADVPLAFGQDCKAIVARPGLHPLYLGFAVIAIADDIQAMVELAGHGTGKLSTDRLKAIEIVEPSEREQRLFAEAVEPMRKMMSALRDSVDRLAAMRDLLLPKLVTGRMDISKLDIDAVLEGAVV